MEVVGAKAISVLYTEYGNEIRHYSTIRTSLTTFLITVSLTAFGTYLGKDNHSPFLVAAGLIFSLAAICACLYFSYRSEKVVMRYTRAREAFVTVPDDTTSVTFSDQVNGRDIRSRMWEDPMNWLLVLGDILLIVCFVFARQVGTVLTCLGLIRS